MNLLQKIKFNLIPESYTNRKRILNEYVIFNEWLRNDCVGLPPHVFKQNIIFEFQKKYGYETLIETGTYKGDMVEAQKKYFNKIYSIELSIKLYRMAKKRFRKDKNIEIIQGDSGKVLSSIVGKLTKPAIFWLDGHYSAGMTAKGDKECPIFEELEAIFNAKTFNHILLIDDARCFTGQGDYPTIEELTQFVSLKNPAYNFEIKKDIICFSI
jgi:hypothetical protein